MKFVAICRGDEDDFSVLLGVFASEQDAIDACEQAVDEQLGEFDASERVSTTILQNLTGQLVRGDGDRHATVRWKGIPGMSDHPAYYQILVSR